MVLFALLPTGGAIVAFLFVHQLVASASSYALARSLGLRWFAAVLTATAYASSGFFQFNNLAAPPYVGIATWLPVALVASERSLRASPLRRRVAWMCLSGLALSQTLAVWPGQGSYYAVLAFAAWTLPRTWMMAPIGCRLQRRAIHAVVQVSLPLLLALLSDAAALLPRVELLQQSNLASGYPVEDRVGGWTIGDFSRLATPGPWSAGVAVLALAAVGLIALRSAAPALRRAIIVAAGVSAAALVLASSTPTPLHNLLYAVLPGFARLHPHVSERALIVVYLGLALLAGLGLQALQARFCRLPIAPIALLAVSLELLIVGRVAIDSKIGATWDPLTRTFDPLGTPSAVALFLRVESQAEPSRYVGFGPETNGQRVPYTWLPIRFASRAIAYKSSPTTRIPKPSS